MKRHLLLFLLALSLLFNLFFVVGYARARRAVGGREDAAVRVAEDLRLDEAQRSRFQQLVKDDRAERAVFDDAITFARIELLEELARPTPDEAKVAELTARKNELEQQRRQARSEFFEEFFRSLEPEQRERLRERLRRGHERHGPPRRFLEQHDANHDGKVDDEELGRALRDGGPWPPRPDPAQLLERHDADKSGCLEAGELEKLLRERGPRRHGPHPNRDRNRPPAGAPPGDEPPIRKPPSDGTPAQEPSA